MEQVDQRTGTVTINVEGVTIDVAVDKDVPQNAQKYYEKAKVMKAKAEGAERALARSITTMDQERGSAGKQLGSATRRPKKKKTRWFERYRWFFSTDGFLVIGGRDAETNEELVKKYLEPRDLFLHADVHGAPAVIVKSQGKEIPEPTLREAAQFAVSYLVYLEARSGLWSMLLGVSKPGFENPGIRRVRAQRGFYYSRRATLYGIPSAACNRHPR